jgi:hypothetical protein
LVCRILHNSLDRSHWCLSITPQERMHEK